MIKKILFHCGILCALLCLSFSAGAVDALKADITASNMKTEFFVRLSQKPAFYKYFFLENPKRLAIDVADLTWKAPAMPLRGLITKVRFGTQGRSGRVVLDINRKVLRSHVEVIPHPREKNAFLLHAVFIHDVLTLQNQGQNQAVLKAPAMQSKAQPILIKKLKSNDRTYKFTSKHPFTATPKRPNEILVVIDAGHGGNDPGAITPSKLYEKNITLQFSKELANRINRTYGMRAILTREADYYIPLAERVAIAQYYHADLFISIHADSLPQTQVHGTTVYTLSDKASDNVADMLAKSENRSDMIAGVKLPVQEPEIADILIDLVRRETDTYSYEFATHLVGNFKKVTDMMKTPHRTAGFAVLKAPDIPSVLIELGYLTNKNDVYKLVNNGWRNKMITQMVASIGVWHRQKKHF